MLSLDAPELYYLANFRKALAWLDIHHRDLMDDAERAFRGVMGMEQQDRLAEMVITQLRVRDQQLPRQSLRSAGHQRSRCVTSTPAWPNISATSGSFL